MPKGFPKAKHLAIMTVINSDSMMATSLPKGFPKAKHLGLMMVIDSVITMVITTVISSPKD